MATSSTPAAELVRARLAAGDRDQAADGRQGPSPSRRWRSRGRCITCLRSGGKVIFFGNGGSAQDAGHLAAELMGRFAFDRPGLSAMSLPDATAAMTAIGNDYSYDEVFARQVLAVGPPGRCRGRPDHIGKLDQRRPRA